MKKEISKIVMVIGFLVALVGLLIWAVSDVEIDFLEVDEDLNISLAQLQEFLFPNLFQSNARGFRFRLFFAWTDSLCHP